MPPPPYHPRPPSPPSDPHPLSHIMSLFTKLVSEFQHSGRGPLLFGMVYVTFVPRRRDRAACHCAVLWYRQASDLRVSPGAGVARAHGWLFFYPCKSTPPPRDSANPVYPPPPSPPPPSFSNLHRNARVVILFP